VLESLEASFGPLAARKGLRFSVRGGRTWVKSDLVFLVALRDAGARIDHVDPHRVAALPRRHQHAAGRWASACRLCAARPRRSATA
jgi:hypothetical protein